jgi:hypothetical protein
MGSMMGSPQPERIEIGSRGASGAVGFQQTQLCESLCAWAALSEEERPQTQNASST